jgi:hypothetical protein
MSPTTLPAISLNREAHIDIWKIGAENQPIFVVDNALADPSVLIDYALHNANFDAPPQKSFYPGVVALVPDIYRDNVLAALFRPMVGVFGMIPSTRGKSYGFFGLTTLNHSDMSPRQRAPHVDSSRMNSFATVHYLSESSFGGTAFYRHKATGLEVVTPATNDRFNRTRQQELDAEDGTPLDLADIYEEIAYIEPKFNRLILYRAGQLHSARLDQGAALTDDPRTGRLTANLFFNTE